MVWPGRTVPPLGPADVILASEPCWDPPERAPAGVVVRPPRPAGATVIPWGPVGRRGWSARRAPRPRRTGAGAAHQAHREDGDHRGKQPRASTAAARGGPERALHLRSEWDGRARVHGARRLREALRRRKSTRVNSSRPSRDVPVTRRLGPTVADGESARQTGCFGGYRTAGRRRRSCARARPPRTSAAPGNMTARGTSGAPVPGWPGPQSGWSFTIPLPWVERLTTSRVGECLAHPHDLTGPGVDALPGLDEGHEVAVG